MSLVIDASAIIDAWDNYPKDQFPGFWRWVSAQITSKRWCMTRVNLDEVGHMSPDLKHWLDGEQLTIIAVSGPIAHRVQSIKNLLGIQQSNYHVDGVDENDLILVATCIELSFDCMSHEKIQSKPPTDLRRCKIPAVCSLVTPVVKCVRLSDEMRGSAVVFDTHA